MLGDDNPDTPAVVVAPRRCSTRSRGRAASNRELQVTGSIGIVPVPRHGALSRLIPHAGAALRAAKHMGGATYCFFEAQMVAGRRDEAELLRDLRGAIEQKELELVYQPKIHHAPSGRSPAPRR